MMTSYSPPAEAAQDLLEQARLAIEAQHWSEALAHAQCAQSAPLTPPALAETLLIEARCHWHRGHLLRVHPPALQAAELARQSGDTRLRVQALHVATLALSELGLADEALPLAQTALQLAQAAELHLLLPPSISYVAHVHARLGDIQNAELMHMQALSLARESAELILLHQAYCNLFVSFHLAHEEQRAEHGAAAAASSLRHARRYTGHALSLLNDERLDLHRRATLMLGLGHVLLLCGQLEEAEQLLQGCARISEELGSLYYLMSARQSLAELRRQQDRAAEALELLQDALSPPPGLGAFSLQLEALRTAQACHEALGQSEPARAHAAELAAALRSRDAMRQQARLSYRGAGAMR